MLLDSAKALDVSALRQFVQHTLCEQNNLEPGAFPMHQKVLVQGKKECGLIFCIDGPRSVKLTAVWDKRRSVVLFYDSAGERIASADVSALVYGPGISSSLVEPG